MKRVLITGGAGFVGHHFVEHFLKHTDWHVVVLDKLTYASNGYERLRDIEAYREDRVTILSSDFSRPLSEGVKQEIGAVDYIFHLGAESHVDNSITNPEPFVTSNVIGTMYMLNFAVEQHKLGNLQAFFYFSTDEVFGPAPEGVDYKESDRHEPSNPYSASKSGGEMLVKAYMNSYGLSCVITRSMNIFGERQHHEKYIPLVIKKVLNGEVVTIHANSDKTKAGSRFYIHARNVADGYMHLVNIIEDESFDFVPGHVIGQTFHITGQQEVDNLQLAQLIAKYVSEIKGQNYELKYELTDYHSSRPGHDLRYALNGEKMRRYGWEPPKTFEESLRKTIEWTLSNDKWLK